MKHRHVFRTGDPGQATQAVREALPRGTPDDDIHLVAWSDIEIRHVHNRRKMADSDFIPAAMRGALLGAAIGLLASLALTLFWNVDLVAILLGVGMGAVVGALASSLVGAAIPDPIRRQFEKEIKGGSVFEIVDAEESLLPSVLVAMEAVSAIKLPYEAPSAMT